MHRLFRLGLIVRIADRRLFLFQIVRLLQEVQRHDLHHVNHAIVTPKLFDLVQVVQDGVLGLVHLEDARVRREERPHQVLRRNDSITTRSLLKHVIACETEHVESLEWRQLGQAIVERRARCHEFQWLLETKAVRDLELMLAHACQVADELEELRQRQQVRLDKHDFALGFARVRFDVWVVLEHGRLFWVEVLVATGVSS